MSRPTRDKRAVSIMQGTLVAVIVVIVVAGLAYWLTLPVPTPTPVPTPRPTPPPTPKEIKVFYAQDRFICECDAQGCSLDLAIEFLRNEADEDVEDLMFRFYNAKGEVVHERKGGGDLFLEPIRIPAGWTDGRGVGFGDHCEEEITRYDVVAIDKHGNEYICIRGPLLWMSGCSGWGDTEPVSASDQAVIEKVMRDFLAAFNARDFDRCLSYFTEFGEEAQALSQLDALRHVTGEWTFEQIESIVIAKKTVVVCVKATMDDRVEIRSMRLKQVDGNWKLIW